MEEYKVTAIIQVRGELRLFGSDFDEREIKSSADADFVSDFGEKVVKRYIKTIDETMCSAHLVTVWRRNYYGGWSIIKK